MISLVEIAKTFETGLNEALGEDNIKFHIWATAGEYEKPFRDGNTVTQYIIGNLRTTSSSNDANMLIMGVNGLTLDFAIPVRRPRTQAGESPESLQKIVQGQYPFVDEVISVINSYFQLARSFVMQDGEDEYSVAMQAGTSVSGVVDIAPQLGNYVSASVYVQIYFIKNGVMSDKVTVTLDNFPIPFQSAQIGRSNEMNRDVYTDTLVSKVMSSSTAFSIDVNFPANSEYPSEAIVDFMLGGEPNTAHFVSAEWNDTTTRLYLMTLDNVSATAQGVAIVGIKAALVEVVNSFDIVNIPEGFQRGKFSFTNSTAAELTFTVSEPCKLFIAGNAMEAEGTVTVAISASDYEYDEEGEYFISLITDRAVTVTSDLPFQTLTEG